MSNSNDILTNRPLSDQLEFDLETARNQIELFTQVTGVPCVLIHHTGALLIPADEADYPCRICQANPPAAGTPTDDAPAPQNNSSAPSPKSNNRSTSSKSTVHPRHRHWRWIEEAAKFGGRSVFLCENDFAHWAAPLLRGGRLVAGLVAGPVVMMEEDDFFPNAVNLRSLFDSIPRMDPARVTVLSHLLYQLSVPLSQDRLDSLEESAQALEQQSRINEYVQELKARRAEAGVDPDTPSYPIKQEQVLLEHIRTGSVAAAQKSLNELLSHVFFSSGQDVSSLKLRARELIVVLSRAVVGEGADPEEVFGLNFQFVDAIDRQTDENGIIYWMARIVRRFADFILYMPHAAHGRALRRAVSIIRRRSSESLRVEDVAREVHMSPNYFSRVFHREIGETFVQYVNRIRVERASELLRSTSKAVVEIATETGFSDHSYFTRVFRGVMGTTPSRYRESVH